jgi:hypothetical protein
MLIVAFAGEPRGVSNGITKVGEMSPEIRGIGDDHDPAA